MTLKEWNAEQVRLALNTNNRYKYYLEHGDKNPSRQNLVLFYIEKNAKTFEEEHRHEH